jgi:hypothetical protein
VVDANVSLEDPVLIGNTADPPRLFSNFFKSIFGGLMRSIVVDGNRCSFLSETHSNCSADSSRCTGHQSVPSFEPPWQCHDSPPHSSLDPSTLS